MSDCYCDYETPEFYRSARHKSRKLRRCDECRRAIAPGEQYEHVHAKWDGDVVTFNTCERCLALRDWVSAHIPCVCWSHGNIYEDAIEAARAYAHEAPGLLFGAKRRVVLIRRAQRFSEAQR